MAFDNIVLRRSHQPDSGQCRTGGTIVLASCNKCFCQSALVLLRGVPGDIRNFPSRSIETAKLNRCEGAGQRRDSGYGSTVHMYSKVTLYTRVLHAQAPPLGTEIVIFRRFATLEARLNGLDSGESDTRGWSVISVDRSSMSPEAPLFSVGTDLGFGE
jgi:hypothetical protein